MAKYGSKVAFVRNMEMDQNVVVFKSPPFSLPNFVLSINRTGNNINTNASAKLNTPNVSGWTGKSVASPANVMPASFMPCKMKKN